jgi:hypothetical protein
MYIIYKVIDKTHGKVRNNDAASTLASQKARTQTVMDAATLQDKGHYEGCANEDISLRHSNTDLMKY